MEELLKIQNKLKQIVNNHKTNMILLGYKKKEELSPKQKYKKYREEHKNQVKINQKKYRENHKEQIKLHNYEQFVCKCGSMYTQCHKTRHERTLKHKTFIKNI